MNYEQSTEFCRQSATTAHARIDHIRTAIENVLEQF